MGDVWWQTRRGDLKLNSTASANFDKPCLPLFLLSGSSQADEEEGRGTCGNTSFDHHSPNLPHHAHDHMLIRMAMMLKTRRPDQGWQWQESRLGFADHSLQGLTPQAGGAFAREKKRKRKIPILLTLQAVSSKKKLGVFLDLIESHPASYCHQQSSE